MITKLFMIFSYAFAGTEHIQMLLLNNNPIKVMKPCDLFLDVP